MIFEHYLADHGIPSTTNLKRQGSTPTSGWTPSPGVVVCEVRSVSAAIPPRGLGHARPVPPDPSGHRSEGQQGRDVKGKHSVRTCDLRGNWSDDLIAVSGRCSETSAILSWDAEAVGDAVTPPSRHCCRDASTSGEASAYRALCVGPMPVKPGRLLLVVARRVLEEVGDEHDEHSVPREVTGVDLDHEHRRGRHPTATPHPG